MAKIFYVTETTPDFAQVNFFKTEKEALEYGISELPQFDMYDDEMNDEEADGDEWYQGDSLTFKKGILFSFEADGTFVQALEEDEAREYAEDLGDEGGAIFFEGFKRGMYGYIGRGIDGSNIKWDWDGQEINESTGGLKYVKLFEQFVNEQSVPKKFGSEEQFDWKDVEQKSVKSFIGSIKNAKYKMQMKVPDIKRLFIETFDVLTKKFGYEDHQALNTLNSGGGYYIAYHVLNNHEGVDGEMRYSYNPEGRMEEIMLGFQTMSNWKEKAKEFDNGGKIYESVIPNTKQY